MTDPQKMLELVTQVLNELVNWYTPPNDSGPFPLARILEALNTLRTASERLAATTRPSVNEYVADYEFRGDQDYTPTDGERTMIEDAIEGYLASVPERLAAGTLRDALEKIAAMDPKQCRADDLGRAARVAREVLAKEEI